jgi:DNA-directed RNA polymerase specialized sigma24 family protein
MIQFIFRLRSEPGLLAVILFVLLLLSTFYYGGTTKEKNENTLDANPNFQSDYFLRQSIEKIEDCLNAGLFSKGEHLVKKSLTAYFSSQNDSLKGCFAFVTADIYHHLSKFQLAIHYFNHSYFYFKSEKDEILIAEAALGLAETYKFLQNYKLSVRYCYEAIALHSLQNNVADEMTAKTILSKCLILAKNYNAAEKIIKEVHQYYQAKKDAVSAAICLENQASLQFQRKKFPEALALAESALEIFKSKKDKDGEITACQLLSKLHLQKENYPDAILYANNSLDLIAVSEDKRGLYDAHLLLANIYWTMKDENRALDHLRAYKKNGTEAENPAVDMKLHHFMLNYYKKKEDWKSAVTAAEKYNQLKEELERKQQTELIAEMNIRYGVREKEKQIQQEKALNIRRKSIITGLCILLILLLLFANWHRLSQRRRRDFLQQEIKRKEQKLMQFTSHLLDKNKLIQSFEKQLQEVGEINDEQSLPRTQKLQQLYQLKILTEDDWKIFQNLYREVYPSFIERIKKSDENLSEGDIRHLLLVKLQLSTREISEMLGVSVNSVRVSRHRLKKKLNIHEDTNLKDILDSF